MANRDPNKPLPNTWNISTKLTPVDKYRLSILAQSAGFQVLQYDTGIDARCCLRQVDQDKYLGFFAALIPSPEFTLQEAEEDLKRRIKEREI